MIKDSDLEKYAKLRKLAFKYAETRSLLVKRFTACFTKKLEMYCNGEADLT